MTSIRSAGPSTGTSATSQSSPRLRADVALYAAREGHVLLVGDAHHHVDLDDGETAALLDALVHGHTPTPDRARAALASLADAGLVDLARANVTVTGEGVLATALRASLDRMGVSPGCDAVPVLAIDDDVFPANLPDATRTCWVSGHRVMLSPPAVPAPQAHARHRAVTLHRDADPDLARRDGGREVRSSTSPLDGPGLELAAVQVAAELLRPSGPSHEAVVIDLVAFTVSRHTVLPVPTAPR